VTAGPYRERYLLVSETAEILLVTPKTISRWAKEGRLPYVRTLGGHRRYPESKILELARAMRHSPTT
jgi:excisionase family DNA binding protein